MIYSCRYDLVEDIMSEENINQESQSENSAAPIISGKSKSKTKVIITSVVIVLVIIAAVIGILLYLKGSIAQNIEKALNASIESQKENFEVAYTPFKCDGSTTIVCKSDNISFSDGEIKLNLSNNVLTLTPSIKTADMSVKTDAEFGLLVNKQIISEPVKATVSCNNKAEFVENKPQILNNITCDSTLNTINNKQISTVYIAHDDFKVGNMIELIKNMYSSKQPISDKLNEIKYLVKSSHSTISSDQLASDIVGLIGLPFPVDMLRNQFNESRDSLYADTQNDPILSDLFTVTDNLFNANHNTIEVDIKIKDSISIDEEFPELNPESYDIRITSK